MAKREWKIGELTVTIEAPDGLAVKGATVSLSPQNREEFLTMATALGGLGALHIPELDNAYQQSANAYPLREDGTKDTRCAVMLYEPPRGHLIAKPRHPFFGPLADRRDRERSPTASTAETRAKGTAPVAEGEGFPPMEASSDDC
jgi:hypothetical protein